MARPNIEDYEKKTLAVKFSQKDKDSLKELGLDFPEGIRDLLTQAIDGKEKRDILTELKSIKLELEILKREMRVIINNHKVPMSKRVR